MVHKLITPTMLPQLAYYIIPTVGGKLFVHSVEQIFKYRWSMQLVIWFIKRNSCPCLINLGEQIQGQTAASLPSERTSQADRCPVN